MKKSKITKLMSLLLCTVMLFSTIISSSALTLQTFAGTIISETDIDLSGIEVKIYSSDPVYDEEGNISYYAETYERSVYTDADGVFEFVKPTAYCSYTVNVETLPAGYGISKHTQFIVPSRTADSIDIAPIATADTELEGDNIVVTFSDADGKTLYTDYEIVPDTAETVSAGNMQSITETETVMTYSALKALDSYTYSGTIVTNGKSFRYSEDHDLSTYSEIAKADFLFSIGVISEDERYGLYEKFLGDDTIDQGTHLIGADLMSVDDTVEYTEPSYDDTYPISFGNYIIEVRFLSASFADDQTALTSFYSTIVEVFRYFCVTNDFQAPIGITDVLPIYITSSTGADYGRTYSTNSGKSIIWIKESLVLSGEAKGTFAHEFMHAIMNGYGILSAADWFDESFASLASFVYLSDKQSSCLTNQGGKDRIWFHTALRDYVYYSYSGLHLRNVDLFVNGALLYPLCIYENYGGWDTIINIFNNYSSASSDYSALQGNGFDYESLFVEMAVNNLVPLIGYDISSLFYGTSFWPLPDVYGKDVPSSYSNQIAPMANRYYKYESATNIGILYVTAESSSDVTFSFGLGSNFTNATSGVSRVTFTANNFGSYSASLATVIVTNTSTGNSASTFTITSKVE